MCPKVENGGFLEKILKFFITFLYQIQKTDAREAGTSTVRLQINPIG